MQDYSSIFGQRAARYVKASELFSGIRSQEFSRYASLLAPAEGQRVLDVPAGNGMARDYLPSACVYVAQDPARDFASACRAQGIEVRQAPLRDSGFESGSFDVIGSLTGLHHEAQRGQIYLEWARLLKPAGRLVILDVATGSLTGTFLNGFVDRWNSEGHRGDFLGEEDLSIIRNSGFRLVTAKILEYCWVSDTERDMHRFMTDLFGLDLEPSLAALVEELGRLGARRCEKGYSVPWALLAITAERDD